MKATPVLIEATDWAIYEESRPTTDDFCPIDCIVIGNLLEDGPKKVVVCLETFIGESTGIPRARQTLAIPKSCVKKIRRLK